MAIAINTTNFERTHGKKPRGFGKWAFEISRFSDGKTFRISPRSMTFSEASKCAREFAKDHSCTSIKVEG